MSEAWRPTVGYEGYYEVSDRGGVRRVGGGLLKPYNDGGLRLRVTLSKRGSRRLFNVHDLVLAAFVGPCPEGLEGCHWDGDATNNSLTNLRWDTRSANQYDKVRHGRHPMAKRTHCANGHEFTPENTWRRKSGARGCRACQRRYKAVARG